MLTHELRTCFSVVSLLSSVWVRTWCQTYRHTRCTRRCQVVLFCRVICCVLPSFVVFLLNSWYFMPRFCQCRLPRELEFRCLSTETFAIVLPFRNKKVCHDVFRRFLFRNDFRPSKRFSDGDDLDRLRLYNRRERNLNRGYIVLHFLFFLLAEFG